MSTVTIQELQAEISLLQVELDNTQQLLERVKLEYQANYLVNLGGEVVDRMQVEQEIFWADFTEEDDYYEYLGKLYSADNAEDRLLEIGRHRDVCLLLKDLPQDCCSLFLMIQEKKEQIKELESKSHNKFFQFILLIGNLF